MLIIVVLLSSIVISKARKFPSESLFSLCISYSKLLFGSVPNLGEIGPVDLEKKMKM